MRWFFLIVAAFTVLLVAAASPDPLGPWNVRVIDGDTIDARNVRYRLVGFDTPETTDRAKCPAERALGARATERLRQIVAAGNIELTRVSCNCRPGTEGTRACNYGRLCGILKSNGRDVGDILISEGLATLYICSRTPCPPMPRWC